MSLPLKEVLKIGTTMLENAGVPDAEHDAKELYMYQSGYDRVGLMMHFTDILQDNAVDRYMEMIERRCSREPLQHITGSQDFMGLTFFVNENVLIPRQDTETVVSEALNLIKKQPGYVLDLCTGSGVIAVTIAKNVSAATVTATDVSKEALEVAEKNAKDNGVKVKFMESDMFEALKGAFGPKKFDYIVSNPPYITNAEIETLEPEVKEHEPMLALSGGDDGLEFYRIIAEKAPEHLKKGGYLVLEIGYDQGRSVPQLLWDTGRFDDILIYKDLADNDRCVTARVKDLKK